MIKQKTIRTRILLWFMSAVFFVLLLSSVSFYFFMMNFLYSNAEQTIRDKNFAVGGWIDFQDKDLDYQLNDYKGSQESAIFIQVSDLSGAVLGHTDNLKEKLLLSDSLAQVLYKIDDVVISSYKSKKYGDLLIANGTAVDGLKILGYIQVAIQKEEIIHILNEVIKWILISIPFLLLLSFFIARLLARKLLAPFALITDFAKGISADEISEKRLPVINPADELGKLTLTINDFLERIDVSVRVQKVFVANAAHELRTPLTIMQAEIELALKYSEDLVEYKQVLASNLEEVQRLSHLSEQLLSLAKLDLSLESISKEKIDLIELCQTVIRRFSKLLSVKDISCLLQTEDPIFIYANSLNMECVIRNLIDNAIKYSSPKTQINISFQQTSTQIIFMLTDQGIGIPKEDIPFIFNRFYRVNKARSGVVKGVGLGLAIVKSIIDNHQGDISIVSEPTQGTTVKIILPNISV